MESIGDVLKAMPNGNFIERAERKFQEVIAHPDMVEWLQQQPAMEQRLLRLHMNSLYQWLKERQHCAQCPGLERCPNDYAGHYTQIHVHGEQPIVELVVRKQACGLLQTKQTEQELRSRIRCFFVDEQVIQQGFSASEILAKDLERATAVKHIIQYIMRTKEHGLQARGLYLYGPFGTGKTFLLSYLLHELAKSGLSGAIVYMPDFIEEIKAMIQDPQRLRETIELLKQTDLLVFDDVGAENLSPWVRDHVFGAVLNDRMGRKPTFFTSNFDLQNLQTHFSFTAREGDEEHKGQRLMERMRPFVDTIYVGGTNKRES